MTVMLFSFILFLFSGLPTLLESGCVFKDPGFDKNPKVIELSPKKLRVEWNRDDMNDVDCVDHFFVHCWKTDSENRDNGQKIHLNKNTFKVDIEVEDDTNYSIQINAFEDGSSAWMGDNWSNKVFIRTSTTTTTTTTTTTKTTTMLTTSSSSSSISISSDHPTNTSKT